MLNHPDLQHIMHLFNARIVGGAVRNIMLNLPYDDIDLATPLRVEQMIAICDEHRVRYVPSGLKHGTITVLKRGVGYEITTLRKDVQTDGRHAIVEFTDDWHIDAERRDFTINALYMDAQGVVYDYFDGQTDLQKGIVRFIGDAHTRIREDYLRIMRFFRFYARFGNVIDERGLQACYDLQHGLTIISKERIYTELKKTVSAVKANEALLYLKPILQHINYPICTRKLPALCDPLLAFALFTGDWRDKKLSKQELRFIHDMRSMTLNSKEDWLSAKYHYDDHWLRSKLTYDTIVRGIDPMTVQTYLQSYKSVIFPISGRDLLHKYQGEALAAELRRLKRIWFTHDMTLEKDELLAL